VNPSHGAVGIDGAAFPFGRRSATLFNRFLPLLLAGAGVPGLAQSVAPPAADMILVNGEIRTPGGWVQAMAVKNGVIVAVGDVTSVSARRGASTQVIDLKGKAVLPGLHDSHVHALFAGAEQFACGFAPGAKPAAISAALKACVGTKKPGEWIQGGNWVGAVFAKGQQTAAFLDKIAPDNPVVLTDESHHSTWVNSAALKLAGITRATQNPQGGIIERDARGEPTGVLRESASRLVGAVIPLATEEEKRRALILSTSQMLSFGITSFTDAGVTDENAGTMAALAGEGLMKQRVRGCIRWAGGGPDAARAASEDLIRRRSEFTKGRFSPDCVKIVLDGVPTESHTAAMLAPYEGTAHSHGDGREKGLLMIPQPVLNEGVTRFDREGLIIKFHAAGDGAVRAAIDAVAAARTANGMGGAKHDVGHNSFVDMADIPRARDIGMTWEFSPYIWYPTPIAASDIRAAVGDERMKRWIPIKDALDTGALVVAGSDWSVVPSVNPWLAIETMVTRQKPGGSKETLGEAERVTLDQAFRIFTENGALQAGHRDKVGSLEPGMHADFVVTAENPFKVPVTRIHATKVEMTFIDGEKVFDIASPPPLTAR
jgi:predicted amidohydrolase YtcJ